MSIHQKANVQNLIGRARIERERDAKTARCDWCGYPVTHLVHRRTGCARQRARVEAQFGVEPESHRTQAMSGRGSMVEPYSVSRVALPTADGMKTTRI